MPVGESGFGWGLCSHCFPLQNVPKPLLASQVATPVSRVSSSRKPSLHLHCHRLISLWILGAQAIGLHPMVSLRAWYTVTPVKVYRAAGGRVGAGEPPAAQRACLEARFQLVFSCQFCQENKDGLRVHAETSDPLSPASEPQISATRWFLHSNDYILVSWNCSGSTAQ